MITATTYNKKESANSMVFVPDLSKLKDGIIDLKSCPDHPTVTLCNIPNGLRIINILRGVTTLRFIDSPELTQLPDLPLSFPEVQIDNCGIAVLRQLPTFLERLTISNCANLIGFGEQVRFPGQVRIAGCHRIAALSGLQGFIKSLVVEDCLALNRLEVPFFLTDLHVRNCPGITANGVIVNNKTIKIG